MTDGKAILKGTLLAFILLAALYSITRVLHLAPNPNENKTEEPPPEKLNQTKEMVIGVEYVVHGVGDGFKDLGIPAVKPLPETFSWDKMQKGPDVPIDFTITDRYVREFQENGFTHIVLALRPSAGLLDLLVKPWMSDERYRKTQAIDPQYHPLYSNWVRSVVERYDMDGRDDMPGLRYPVKHYEIGVEFSSYQPEPTEVYLETLELGYKAAHEAYDDVLVGHSAFLVTPVFRDDPGPEQYEEAFAKNMFGTAGKGLADIRMILDRPDLFDILNVHNLGWPYEIESIVKWLNYETGRRDYTKPIVVSDTVPTSFAGLGPATKCQGRNLAVMLPPATEADRCRLAEYFTKLIDRDQAYIDWLRVFLAGDVIQRVIIAAEQGIELIDTAFTGDLPGATLAIFQAAAGNSGWGGMVDYRTDLLKGENIVTGKRPPYYALQQLQAHIRGYTRIVRMETARDLRLYEVEKPGETFFVAWYGYDKLYLPGDATPTKPFRIDIGKGSVVIEEMRISPDVSRRTVATDDGTVELELTPRPVYIFAQ